MSGVPTVIVITEPFAAKARLEAKVLGVPALAMPVLPHPIGQISDDDMRRLTDQAYPEVVFALTAGADVVTKAYEKAVKPRSAFSL